MAFWQEISQCAFEEGASSVIPEYNLTSHISTYPRGSLFFSPFECCFNRIYPAPIFELIFALQTVRRLVLFLNIRWFPNDWRIIVFGAPG